VPIKDIKITSNNKGNQYFDNKWNQDIVEGIVNFQNDLTIKNQPELLEEEIIKAPPSFPTLEKRGFYGILGEFTDLATRNSEASKEAVFMSALTAMATFFGSVSVFQLGDGWIEPRLFTVLAGLSAKARKGTSWKPVEKLIQFIQQDHHLVPNYQIPTKYKGNTYPHTELSKMGGLSTAEGLIQEVRDEVITKKNGVEEVTDVGVDDKRLLVVEEELGRVFKIAQREGNTLSQTLREAFDGGIISPMTKHNRIKSTYPHINILGHITKYELCHLMDESDVHNGLYNRFLWACVRRSKVIPLPKPMNLRSLKKIANQLAKSVYFAHQGQCLYLSTRAKKLWKDIYHQIAKNPRTQQRVEALTSRHESHLLRIAMILALLDRTKVVGVKHLAASSMILDYCNNSVYYLFTALNPDDDNDVDVKKLFFAIKQKGSLTRTEISKVFNNHKSKTEIDQLITSLEGGGHILSEKMNSSRGKLITSYTLSDFHN
jgi:hypothetical protein